MSFEVPYIKVDIVKHEMAEWSFSWLIILVFLKGKVNSFTLQVNILIQIKLHSKTIEQKVNNSKILE